MKTCKICEKEYFSSQVDIHHISYNPEIIVPLCKNCHLGIVEVCVRKVLPKNPGNEEDAYKYLNGTTLYQSLKNEKLKKIICETLKFKLNEDRKKKSYIPPSAWKTIKEINKMEDRIKKIQELQVKGMENGCELEAEKESLRHRIREFQRYL